MGFASRVAATSAYACDWIGTKPPRGKKGTQAISRAAKLSISASSSRCARLYGFCTQTMGAIFLASDPDS